MTYVVKSLSVKVFIVAARSFWLSVLTCSHLKFIFYLMAFNSTSHSQSYCKLNVFVHNVDNDEIHQLSCKLDIFMGSYFSFWKKLLWIFIYLVNPQKQLSTRHGECSRSKTIMRLSFGEPIRRPVRNNYITAVVIDAKNWTLGFYESTQCGGADPVCACQKGFPQEGTYNLGPGKLLGVSQRMGAGDGHMLRP